MVGVVQQLPPHCEAVLGGERHRLQQRHLAPLATLAVAHDHAAGAEVEVAEVEVGALAGAQASAAEQEHVAAVPEVDGAPPGMASIRRALTASQGRGRRQDGALVVGYRQVAGRVEQDAAPTSSHRHSSRIEAAKPWRTAQSATTSTRPDHGLGDHCRAGSVICQASVPAGAWSRGAAVPGPPDHGSAWQHLGAGRIRSPILRHIESGIHACGLSRLHCAGVRTYCCSIGNLPSTRPSIFLA